MARLTRFFMAASEMVPVGGPGNDRKLVVRMIQSDSREQAVTSFLGNLRTTCPDCYPGLVEVVEMAAPLLNTIAVHVVGNEVNVQAPKLVHDIIARYSSTEPTGGVSDN